MQEITTEYIYGGPWFGGLPTSPLDSFVAPLGQVNLCFEYLKKIPQDMRSLAVQAGKEYLAIAAGMEELGIKFHIVRHGGIPQLHGLSAIFEDGFNLGAILMPKEMDHDLVFYPRDLYGYLRGENAILVNSQIRKFVKIPEKSKGGIYFSPYGVGGSALYAKNTMIVGGRYIDKNVRFRSDWALDILKRKGLRVITVPSPAIRTFSRNGLGDKAGIDEHLDRSMNLVEGIDDRLYLIVDPNIRLAESKDEKKQFSILDREASFDILKTACRPFDIEIVSPARINIPYSMGFMQFANKKVLMTGGDDAVYNVLEKIVGRENIARTYVPAIITAVLGEAGIRCTINEYPAIMREIFPLIA